MAVNPMMETAMSAGVRAMNGAREGLRSEAQEIASLNTTARASAPASGDELKDRAEALSSLKLYERQVQAAAKVVETADEVVGFLLDVHA